MAKRAIKVYRDENGTLQPSNYVSAYTPLHRETRYTFDKDGNAIDASHGPLLATVNVRPRGIKAATEHKVY